MKINGENKPFALTKRAWMLWEKETGLSRNALAENDTVENTFKLIHLGLKEGARKAGEEFKLTFDEVVDLDEDNYLEEQLVEYLTEVGKKRLAFIKEMGAKGEKTKTSK